MESTEKNLVQVLNELIITCRDSEQGFREAAEDVNEKVFSELLCDYARQMSVFQHELTKEMLKLGSAPQNRFHPGSKLHRLWIHFRSFINRKQEKPVLLECERGEEQTLTAYERALENRLPVELRDLVERQFVEIIQQRNHIKNLELLH